jgi:hypothetical protein
MSYLSSCRRRRRLLLQLQLSQLQFVLQTGDSSNCLVRKPTKSYKYWFTTNL